MAQTAADTQREVEAIRADAAASLAELQSRLRAGPTALFRPRDGSVTRVRWEPPTVQRALRVVRENTLAMGILAAVALGALGLVLRSALDQRRERRTPYNRLLRRAHAARERVAERAARARHSLDERRARGILVKVAEEGGDYLRVTNVRLG